MKPCGWWVSGALLGVTVAGACGGPRTPAAERAARATRGRGDVVVAVAWPWASRTEIRYWEGLQMAVAEINAAGGVGGRMLRLVRYDDLESVDEGRIVAQQIAQRPEVVAVIGHLQSYVTVPAAAIYDQAGLVHVAPTATDPELTARGFPRVFRAIFTDEAMGRQLAEFAASRGHRRVAICYIRNTYGRDLANAFERRAGELGVTIAARQSYDPGEQVNGQTFEPTLRQWKDLELDALFLAGEVPSGAFFVAEARRQGFTLPILGGDAMGSPALLSIAGSTADGVIVASIFHADEPQPEVRAFAAAFAARFGAPPDAGSALGYDAVRLLAAGMRDARSVAPDAVARALHALKQWPGVTGAFTFDTAGNLLDRRVVTTVVRNGRFELLSEPSLARAATAPP